MEYQFGCSCESVISGSAPGSNPELSESVRCEDCGADYVITITNIGAAQGERVVEPFGVGSNQG